MGLFPTAALVAVLAVSCASSPPGTDTRRASRSADGVWLSASNDPRRRPAPSAPEAPIQPLPLDSCGDTERGFDGWLESFRQNAIGRGVSARTVGLALEGVTYDARVIELDRSQAAFKLSFEEFFASRVTRGRIARGRDQLGKHATLLSRIHDRYGVAPEVLVAIWGLESDFGDNAGSTSCFRALATLAYDCRRSARFRDELMSALRIVERGDLAPADMIGAWAGELGQTQFLPSSYERFAIDFDGDGRADVIGSRADALASTASYLQAHGWQRGADYRPGAPNFAVLGEWNASEVYRKTIAAFAAKLAPRGARTTSGAKGP